MTISEIASPKRPTKRDRRDLTGETFGKWLVRERTANGKPNAHYKCECVCGTIRVVSAESLKRGKSSSCGCYRVNQIKSLIERNTKYGLTETPEYGVWCGMKKRCFNSNSADYKNYGGRGITVCDRWVKGEDGLSGFGAFILDVGQRPSDTHSIERLNVNGNYEPRNVCWATPEEQANNQRPKRKSIPDRTKLEVVLNQDGKCPHCGQRLGRLDGLNFDHRPALINRDIDQSIKDYVPGQLDPEYIQAVHIDCHKVRTSGATATTAGSDLHIRDKTRNLQQQQKEYRDRLLAKDRGEPPPKPKKPKYQWPKRKMESRNSFKDRRSS